MKHLLLLLSVAAAAAAAATDPTTVSTSVALLSFKSLLLDPNNSLASWNNNSKSLTNYCNWRGVSCGARHPQSVVALVLNSLGLAGPISPSLSNLTFLRSLRLANNQLRGNIPEQLCRLSRLQHLSLTNNMLDGEIPVCVASLPELISLYLGGNDLVGAIPPLLGSGPSLAHVELWNNSLTGSIPLHLANSSALQDLLLFRNNLVGTIPSPLGGNMSSSLVQLDLAYNSLTGNIPPFFANPSSPLVYLDLSENQLTGEIPPNLGNLSSLQVIHLEDNHLEGSIPESLSNIPYIAEIIVSDNNLSGVIPSSIFNISAITIISAEQNSLSGTLPSNLALPNLQWLSLSRNRLEGPIPMSLSNASGLELLELADNTFSGFVPPNLGSLQNLSYLNLGGNQIQAGDWSFLSSLSNCSLLNGLVLGENKLEGTLPSSVGNLSAQLQHLDIEDNRITGNIPVEIHTLTGLMFLSLSGNLFDGSIPATIGKLRNLNEVYLFGNKLSGPIPLSIGNLTQLSKLFLQRNELNGTIPATIGDCESLSSLDLSDNSLGGSIPRELVSLSSLSLYVNLSYNSLIGAIPSEVGSLINLGIFDVSKNRLSGDIPSTLGACQHLEELHMEGNSFQGGIPRSFENLKGLKELDLSSNKLSGEIPNFFRSLHLLQTLNLSFNDFEGEVPRFKNASVISVLGNKQLCGGDLSLRLPPCSTHDTPKQKNKHLRTILILVISATVILALSLLGFLLYYRRKRGGQPSASTALIGGEKYKKISYSDIHKATKGFSSANLVGAGSFGSVYKASLDSEERIVAVKVLNLRREGALRSFTAECEALRSIRHRNLVKIITTCSSLDFKGNDFKALIYEYMPNGSLEKWLDLDRDVGFEIPHLKKLTFIQRVNILIDVASGLDYIHHNCNPPVIHCDLKPSNVLLGEDMTAHVGDFGLARLLSDDSFSVNSSSLMGIKGTIGYVPPEYGLGGGVSTHGDVYSFGMVLLEMMTGKRPTDDTFKDGLSLRKYVESAFSTDGFISIMDRWLVSGDKNEGNDITNSSAGSRGRCMHSLIRIGLSCTNYTPKERMEMREVVTELIKLKEQLLKCRFEGR